MKDSATVVATTTLGATDGRRPSVDDILCLSVTTSETPKVTPPLITATPAHRAAPPRESSPPPYSRHNDPAGTPLRAPPAGKSHTPPAGLHRAADRPNPD